MKIKTTPDAQTIKATKKFLNDLKTDASLKKKYNVEMKKLNKQLREAKSSKNEDLIVKEMEAFLSNLVVSQSIWASVTLDSIKYVQNEQNEKNEKNKTLLNKQEVNAMVLAEKCLGSIKLTEKLDTLTQNIKKNGDINLLQQFINTNAGEEKGKIYCTPIQLSDAFAKLRSMNVGMYVGFYDKDIKLTDNDGKEAVNGKSLALLVQANGIVHIGLTTLGNPTYKNNNLTFKTSNIQSKYSGELLFSSSTNTGKKGDSSSKPEGNSFSGTITIEEDIKYPKSISKGTYSYSGKIGKLTKKDVFPGSNPPKTITSNTGDKSNDAQVLFEQEVFQFVEMYLLIDGIIKLATAFGESGWKAIEWAWERYGTAEGKLKKTMADAKSELDLEKNRILKEDLENYRKAQKELKDLNKELEDLKKNEEEAKEAAKEIENNKDKSKEEKEEAEKKAEDAKEAKEAKEQEIKEKKDELRDRLKGIDGDIPKDVPDVPIGE